MTQGIIAFRPFNPNIPRQDFDCGNDAINTWFRKHASQQEKRDNVRTHLGLATSDSRIASFFSLVTHRIELTEAARTSVLSRAKYSVPAVLIAQLAVDRRYQGQGLGALTLGHAIHLLAESSRTIGFEVVLVDAVDPAAAEFYRRFGFEDLVEGGQRLYLTTKALRASDEGPPP